jgi:hypothetical protein
MSSRIMHRDTKAYWIGFKQRKSSVEKQKSVSTDR